MELIDLDRSEAHAVELDGSLGRRPALRPQLFCVASREGTIAGGDGVPHPIRNGQAALADPGEEHESRTRDGMVALILEVAATTDLAAG